MARYSKSKRQTPTAREIKDAQVYRVLYRNDFGKLQVIHNWGHSFVPLNGPRKYFQTLSGAERYVKKQGYKEVRREYYKEKKEDI